MTKTRSVPTSVSRKSMDLLEKKWGKRIPLPLLERVDDENPFMRERLTLLQTRLDRDFVRRYQNRVDKTIFLALKIARSSKKSVADTLSKKLGEGADTKADVDPATSSRVAKMCEDQGERDVALSVRVALDRARKCDLFLYNDNETWARDEDEETVDEFDPKDYSEIVDEEGLPKETPLENSGVILEADSPYWEVQFPA